MRRSRPGPAIHTDLTGIVEVVEIHELAGQIVQIGRYRASKFRDARIAVANIQITKNLVVSAVFLDDVNDVVNMALQESQLVFLRVARPAAKIVVGRDSLRQAPKLSFIRNREALESRLDELQIVLIACAARC